MWRGLMVLVFAVAACRSTTQGGQGGTPEEVFLSLQRLLRVHAYAHVLELLDPESRAQLSSALEDPSFARGLGLNPEALRAGSLGEAFAQVLAQDRLRNEAQYRCLAEGEVGRVEVDGEDCELRCYHPETEQVRVLILRRVGGRWRIRDLL